MRLPHLTARALLAACVAVGTTACSFITGVHGTSRVTVTLAPDVIGLNQTAQAIGTAFDGDTPLSGNNRYNVTFTSRDANIATVDEARGVVIGKSYGTAYIVGENRGKRDSAKITVRPVQAVQLIIGGTRTPTYRVNAPNTIGATAFDSSGRGIGDRSATWTSRDPAVLTISPIGAISPLTTGTSWVVASIDNGPGAKPAVDSVRATVTPPPIVAVRITPNNDNNNYPIVYTGQTLQFRATLTDSLNATATRAVTWSVPNSGTLLTIDASSGLATGVAPSPFSTTTVTATTPVVPNVSPLQTIGSSVNVYVLAPIDSVSVLNGASKITTLTVSAGSTTQLTLVPLDVLRNALLGSLSRNVKLTSSNAAVFAVPAIGTSSAPITAVAAGTATFTAQGLDNSGNPQGRASTVTITVQ